MAELHNRLDYKAFRAAITKSDTDGEVIFAEANPSGTPLIERAPKRAFVLISDFAISIKSAQEPNVGLG
jgi:hypothetical protein